jgi:hypothetical protein
MRDRKSWRLERRGKKGRKEERKGGRKGRNLKGLGKCFIMKVIME